MPITFIGKVRPDGSERLVRLNLTGTIRYFIATAPQTTCIYRSVNDVKRYENEQRKRAVWEDPVIVSNSVTPRPSPNSHGDVGPHVPKRITKLFSPPILSDYTTVFSSQSCTCASESPHQVHTSSFRGRGGPRYVRNPDRPNRIRSTKDYFREEYGAPYIQKPYWVGKLDASMNPISSWRWSWFSCTKHSACSLPFLNTTTVVNK